MNTDAAADMAVALAAIVGISLALTQAMGGLLVYLTEAIKATGKVKDGYAGIVTLMLGMVLGGALGGLTEVMVNGETYGFWTMVALGIFGGALMAAGAVKTYKAMGEVNTKATAETVTNPGTLTYDLEPETSDSYSMTQADIDAMQAELATSHGPMAERITHTEPAPPLPDNDTSPQLRR